MNLWKPIDEYEGSDDPVAFVEDFGEFGRKVEAFAQCSDGYRPSRATYYFELPPVPEYLNDETGPQQEDM